MSGDAQRTTERRAELERAICELHARGELQEAVTRALRGYGSELYGFLFAMHRNEDEAAEIFAMLSEDLWRGIAGFQFKCSFRTWAYMLARNAAFRYRRREGKRQGREVRLSSSLISQLVADVVSSSAAELGGRRSQLEQLRDSLPPDDRTLLVLRLDKELSWADVARVMLGEDDPAEDALKRETARLRKRFQLVKERLVAQGRAMGMLA